MNILVCQTNPKNVLQIEIKDLTFEVPISPLTFFKIRSYNGPYIYDAHMDGAWWSLKLSHVYRF